MNPSTKDLLQAVESSFTDKMKSYPTGSLLEGDPVFLQAISIILAFAGIEGIRGFQYQRTRVIEMAVVHLLKSSNQAMGILNVGLQNSAKNMLPGWFRLNM